MENAHVIDHPLIRHSLTRLRDVSTQPQEFRAIVTRLTGLLAFAGSVVTFFAIQIGFGAVLLTRAGRRNEWASTYDPDAAWERAMDVDVEVDVDETADKVDEDSDDA